MLAFSQEKGNFSTNCQYIDLVVFVKYLKAYLLFIPYKRARGGLGNENNENEKRKTEKNRTTRLPL
jgi:hypothetical protein